MKIKFTTVVLALLCLQCGAFAAEGRYTPPESPRATFNFNPGWKFIREDVTNAAEVSFDDSKWADVSAPHTFNDVDSYSAIISHSGIHLIWVKTGESAVKPRR